MRTQKQCSAWNCYLLQKTVDFFDYFAYDIEARGKCFDICKRSV